MAKEAYIIQLNGSDAQVSSNVHRIELLVHINRVRLTA